MIIYDNTDKIDINNDDAIITSAFFDDRNAYTTKEVLDFVQLRCGFVNFNRNNLLRLGQCQFVREEKVEIDSNKGKRVGNMYRGSALANILACLFTSNAVVGFGDGSRLQNKNYYFTIAGIVTKSMLDNNIMQRFFEVFDIDDDVLGEFKVVVDESCASIGVAVEKEYAWRVSLVFMLFYCMLTSNLDSGNSDYYSRIRKVMIYASSGEQETRYYEPYYKQGTKIGDFVLSNLPCTSALDGSDPAGMRFTKSFDVSFVMFAKVSSVMSDFHTIVSKYETRIADLLQFIHYHDTAKCVLAQVLTPQFIKMGVKNKALTDDPTILRIVAELVIINGEVSQQFKA